MRIADIADANDHTVTEGDMNIADGATAWVRFALYISTTFTATANDIFNIFEWQQAGGTPESVISMQITAATDVVDIGIADGTESSTFQITGVEKGVWHVIEATMTVSTGSAGVLDLYMDGHRYANLTGLTHAAAVGTAVLGTQNTASTTDVGFLLFDAFAFDNLRIGISDRYSPQRFVTSASGECIFVGPGAVDEVKIIDGGSGDVQLELYDSDVYHESLEPKWRGRTAANDTDEVEYPTLSFSRGCFARFNAGTLPGAMIHITRAGTLSEGAMRNYAVRRHPPSLVTP